MTKPAHSDRMGMDLTQGPILKTLLLFSVPTLLSNVLQTLNSTVNSIWVGRLIGESALAATANANIVLFLLFAAVFGFGMATTVRVGQSFGARNIDAARQVFGTGLGLCLAISLTTSTLGWLGAERLLDALSTPAASRAEALAYLRVTFLSLPFGTLSIMVAMGLRGAGDAKTPLYAMILTVALDILCNPLLIRGFGPVPAFGIAGSAASSAIANAIGLAAMIGWAYARQLPLCLRGRELAYLWPRRAELVFIITKGLPMGAQMLLISAAGVLMVRLVNHEGLLTAAAYGAALQLWNYLQMPAFAISSAVSAMAAQNVGAKLHERVRAITLTGIAANTAFTGGVNVLIVAANRPLLGLFLGANSAALPLAAHAQAIVSWAFVLTGVMMILNGSMRAYGAVIQPLVVLFVALYPARLGFYYLAYPWIGAEALWWSFVAGAMVAMLGGIVAYRLPGWRKIED